MVLVILLGAGGVLSGAALRPAGATASHPTAGESATGPSEIAAGAIRTTAARTLQLRPAGSSLASDVGQLAVNLTYNSSVPASQYGLVAPIPMTSVYDPSTGRIYSTQYGPTPFGDRLLTAVPGTLTLPSTPINLTEMPASIALDSVSGLLYVPEQNQTGTYDLLQTIDPTTDAVVGSYNLTSQLPPSAILFDPVNHNMYVAGARLNNYYSSSNGGDLLAVDTLHGNSATSVPGALPSGFVPFAMATDSNFSTLYIAGVFTGVQPYVPGLVALNLTNYSETVESIPVPNAAAYYLASSVAYDPADGSVYVGVGQDSVTSAMNLSEYVAIYNASTLAYATYDLLPTVNVVLTTLPTVAASLTYDPDNHDLYLTQGASYDGIRSGSGNLNASIMVLDGNLPTNAAPIAVLNVSTFAIAALYVPTTAPGGGAGEIWISSGPSFAHSVGNTYLGGFDVLDLAPIARSLVAAPALLDEGMSTTISTSVVLGAGPLTYSYAGLPYGCVSADLAQFVCTPNGTGTFSVTVSVTDRFGYVSLVSGLIVVHSALAIRPAATPQPLDVDEMAGFTDGAAGGTAPLSAVWLFGDGTNQAGSSVVHAYGAAGVYTVLVTVTDAIGAVRTANLTVVVSAVPSSVRIDANRSSSDVGVPVSFSAGVSGGSLPLTDRWNFGDENGSSTGPQATHVYRSAGVFLVTLTVQDAAGQVSSASLAETVGTAPQVALLAPSAPTAGEPGGFAASVSGGTAPFSYVWTFGGAAGTTSPTPLHTFPTAGSYAVSVQVTDAVGATANQTTTVTVLAAPSTPASSTGTSGSAGGACSSLVAGACGLALGSLVVGILVLVLLLVLLATGRTAAAAARPAAASGGSPTKDEPRSP